MRNIHFSLYDAPNTLYTDESYDYRVRRDNDTDDIGDHTYSFGYRFTCDGATTENIVATGLTSNSYTWSPSTAIFAPLMKRSSSGTLEVFITTTGEDGKKYGNSRVITLTLKTSVKPNISNIIIKKTNAFNDKSVSGITSHTLTFDVDETYTGTHSIQINVNGITSYTVTIINDVPAANAKAVSVEIGRFFAGSSVTTKDIEIIAIDGRGRRSDDTHAPLLSIYPYTRPDAVATVSRNDSGQPVITCTASYQSIVADAENSLTNLYAECNINGTRYHTELLSDGTPVTMVGTYELVEAYTFDIYVRDKVLQTAVRKEIILPSDAPVMDIGSDGNTVTFFGTSPSSADKQTLRIADYASFGEDAVSIGNATGRHMILSDAGLSFYSGLDVIAQIGYGNTSSLDPKGNPMIGSYYTIGQRKSDSLIGSSSYAEGYDTTASGNCAHAEGSGTTASGRYAHAEGSGTTASGRYAHAEGYDTTASGNCAHAEGYDTTASGNFAHAEGSNTTASGNYQSVIGKFNVPDTTSAFIIGNGAHTTNRSNALTVDFYGNVKAAGTIYEDNTALSEKYIGLKMSGNYYYGMTVNGSDALWVRTTSTGLIPHTSGGATDGHCYLGTSSFYFANAYIQNIYGTTIYEGGTALASKYLSKAGGVITGTSLQAGTASSTAAMTVKTINNANNVSIHTNSAAGVWHSNESGYGTGGWLMYISTTGTIKVNTTSDKRLKNYVSDLSADETLSLLTEIKPIIYTYKGDSPEAALDVQSGFYAQDVRDTLIRHNIGYRSYLLIHDNENEGTDSYDLLKDENGVTYGLDYMKFVPTLWKGWQIHQDEIKSLRSEITELKSMISATKED